MGTAKGMDYQNWLSRNSHEKCSRLLEMNSAHSVFAYASWMQHAMSPRKTFANRAQCIDRGTRIGCSVITSLFRNGVTKFSVSTIT